MGSILHDRWQRIDGGSVVDDDTGPNDLTVRAVHVALGLYLMPVAALVLVIGGAAVAVGSAYQWISGQSVQPQVGPPSSRFRPAQRIAISWPGALRIGR